MKNQKIVQRINLIDNIKDYGSIFNKLNTISSENFMSNTMSMLDKLSYIGSLANYGMTASHVLESEYSFKDAIFIHMNYPEIVLYDYEHNCSLISLLCCVHERATAISIYDKYSDRKFHIKLNINLHGGFYPPSKEELDNGKYGINEVQV